jgi:hypothetical protein
MAGKRDFFIDNWYKILILCIKGRIAVFILLGLVLFPFYSYSQSDIDYDEIPVFLNVQRLGGTELTAVIKDETVYLPVTDLFNFIKIKNTISRDLDSISGFFLNQEALYLIDKVHHQIIFQGKAYSLKKEDIIGTETNLYLKSKFFGEIFGLDCAFSFRSLSVTLTTKLELPIIREMRQEQMRANINRLKGEVKADTIIGRNYPFFSMGMADWSVIASQQVKGKSDARLNLTLGSVIAGGETNVSLNYNQNAPFSEKEQYYLWRFVNNDYKGLRQTMLGKISSQATSSIFNPIVGVQLTNTPSTYRRSFGTYTLSDITEPNWIVELYVNSVLVDYVKADANGFFKFEVPLVYGNSAVMLRFYGPWGEEKSREVNISIPFNFLPQKEFEYSVSAGIVEDSLLSRFSRSTVNYGLTSRVTIGGGLEYLSSITKGSSMPFLSTSVRLGNSLLLAGEYTHNVRFKGLMSYRLPSNIQFELDYAHYAKGQKAIIYNYLEERKAIISVPVRSQNFSAYSRLTLNQIVMPNLKNTNAELLLSGALYGVSTNFTTYGLFTDPSNPYIYSNLSLALRLPYRFVFTPQVQYEYVLNEVITARANIEKPLFSHGFLNFSYEQNFKSNVSTVEMGLRYDLPFAQTGFSARRSNDLTNLVQSARGSLLYDDKNRFIGSSNRSSVGKGAVTFLPFLDLNCNGVYDPDEPKVAGLNLRIDGGRMVVSERDTTIRIVDLIPYTSYFVELNKNSFENIAWQIKNQSMSINVDANRFKTIEIPVAVMGEVSGTVYEKVKSDKIGKGRILINFYRNDSLVIRTMSEADGYFSLLGLAPGPYTVRIDTVQLKKVNMTVTPSSLPVTVKRSKEGDVIDGLEFTLSSFPSQTKEDAPKEIDKGSNLVTPNSGRYVSSLDSDKLKKVNKDSVSGTLQKAKLNQIPSSLAVSDKQKMINKDSVSRSPLKVSSGQPGYLFAQGTTEIQVGAFAKKANAAFWLKKAEGISGRKCVIIYEDGLYKVRMQGFKDRIQAGSYLTEVIANGFSDAFVVVYHQGIVIQVSAFINKINALSDQKRITALTGRKFKVVEEKGFYKVRLEGFSGRKEAEDYLPRLIRLGFPEAFIVRDNVNPDN